MNLKGLAQKAEGAHHVRLDRADGDVERGCDFTIGKVPISAEPKHLTLPLGHALYGYANRVDELTVANRVLGKRIHFTQVA